jgi:hypothetical protein
MRLQIQIDKPINQSLLLEQLQSLVTEIAMHDGYREVCSMSTRLPTTRRLARLSSCRANARPKPGSCTTRRPRLTGAA